MAKTILFIGNEDNLHVKEVEKHIKTLDSEARVVLFNPHSDENFVEITAGNVSGLKPCCVVVVNGERVPAEAIKSVWFYLKPPMPSPDDHEDLQGKFFFKHYALVYHC